MSTDSYSIDALLQRLYQFSSPPKNREKPTSKSATRRTSSSDSNSKKRVHSHESLANVRSASRHATYSASRKDSAERLDHVLKQIRNEIRIAVKQSGLHAVRSRFDTSDIVQDSMLQIWKQLQNSDMQEIEFTRGLLAVIAKGHAA